MRNFNIKAIDVVEMSAMEKMNNFGGTFLNISNPNAPYYFEPPFLPKAPSLDDFILG